MFKKFDITKENINPFEMISKQWMLVSAGTKEKYNTMTASWGGVGIIWNKPVATSYIRHSRYTIEFIDKSEYFTLSFLKDGNRQVLNLVGSKSGREIDKMNLEGLTPTFIEDQVTFEEAEIVLICKKKSKSEILKTDIVDENILNKEYSDNDFHSMYIGEIVSAYRNEKN